MIPALHNATPRLPFFLRISGETSRNSSGNSITAFSANSTEINSDMLCFFLAVMFVKGDVQFCEFYMFLNEPGHEKEKQA